MTSTTEYSFLINVLGWLTLHIYIYQLGMAQDYMANAKSVWHRVYQKDSISSD